jgi:hypothetical protein
VVAPVARHKSFPSNLIPYRWLDATDPMHALPEAASWR